MDHTDPTSVIQMIKDLQSTTGGFRRNSGVSLRMSGTGIPMTLMEDNGECSTPLKRKRLDDSTNSITHSVVNKTGSDSAPGSPWEWRRLKGEVVSLRTRLSHQEATVQQLHKIRRQMEEVFEKEKSGLEMQAEMDKQTIKQLEARLDSARRNIQEALQAQATAEKDLSLMRSKLEQKIVSLMNENGRLIESNRHANAGESSIVPTAKDSQEEFQELRILYETSENRVAELEEKLKESRAVQQKLEVQSVELQNAKIKIERLESERALWEDGKLLASRAARASDLEKELNSTREALVAMRESVKGKLLLEEEMCNMSQRLEHMEKVEEQVANLESCRAELLRKLGEYQSIGFGGDATALRKELNRLQQAEAILTSEEGQLRSKIGAIQRENQAITVKYDQAKKIATEMTTSTERLNKLVIRLQKKMMLVTRERDSYRQQLDLYEKEITIDSNNALTERIPALERALEGYRDLVSKLEADLGVTETGVAKDECQKLREEVERLKGELEHRALKGDFNCNARVLHFTMNPAAIAVQHAEEKQQALLREVEELRTRVQVGSGASVVGVSSLHAQEIAELKQTHEIKIARLKDAFRVSSQEYRQACYQLFGWRVDRTKEGEYKLFSQYAESPDDFLYFHVGEEGVDLLETSFSATLGTLIERHLQMQHSVPMFINAVQIDLFAQQTMTNVVS